MMSAAAFERRAWACAAIVGALAALLPVVAGAVDRSLGADVAKPAPGGLAWTSAAKARLAGDIDALLAGAPTLRGAHVGLLALDTSSGDIIYARNADDAFVPASTLKLLTGSVALALLGPAFRFHTEAFLAPSRVYGDLPQQTLFVRAGGDPLLRADDVRAMATAAFATGAFQFPYPVLVDAGAFEFRPYPPGWSWDDFPYDYAAKLSPAPVDENAMRLTVSPGAKVGDRLDIRESPAGARSRAFGTCADPAVTPLEPVATTGQRDSPMALDVVQNPPRGCIQVVGSLPLGASAQALDVAMPEPTAYLVELVGSSLPSPPSPRSPGSGTASGMTSEMLYQSFPLPPASRLVWTHDGEPVADLLADMWLPSDNFVAEMLLRAIGLQHIGAPGTTEHGADAERGWLASIAVDPVTLTIADGSGLSTYDRLTPRALAAILQADWHGPYRDIVLDDLPLAGVRGTLRGSFMRSLAERRTFAKTGSVNHTRGLAGYLASVRHGAVTFAWSLDDWMGTDEDLDAVRARVLSRIIGD